MLIVPFTLPDDLFLKLKEVIKDTRVSFTEKLAGNIAEEYNLDPYVGVVESFLQDVINKDQVLSRRLESMEILNKNVPLRLTSMWVNYQKKHEFNPAHKHSGIFSFVIFVKIPFDMEEQRKISPCVYDKENKAGCLEFLYPYHSVIDRVTIAADRTYEKRGIIFPADLVHCVYPFYGTDEYRITVSGNFKLFV
jgi:hypothetical protein|tara:strand:- start:876 stop:1454 length:579 start_codon:yes stop_codon:yes gene_type:complete